MKVTILRSFILLKQELTLSIEDVIIISSLFYNTISVSRINFTTSVLQGPKLKAATKKYVNKTFDDFMIKHMKKLYSYH